MPRHTVCYAFADFDRTRSMLDDYANSRIIKSAAIDLGNILSGRIENFFVTDESVLLASVRQELLTQAKSTQRSIAVVLHLDEYQDRPKASAAILRAVRDFNLEIFEAHQPPRPLVVICVLTGLSAEHLDSAIRSNSVTATNTKPFTVHLHYIAEEHVRHALVKNAASAVNTKAGWTQINNVLFKRLVSDTLGWPQALVQLGGALGQLEITDKLTEADLRQQLTVAERFYVTRTQEIYKEQLKDAVAENVLRHEKLLRLALSPIAVSL